MIKIKKIFKKNSIVNKIIPFIIIVNTIFCISIAILYSYNAKKTLKNQLQHTASDTIEHISQTLVLPIQNNDTVQIKEIINNEMRQENIFAIIVKEDKNILFAKQKNKKNQIIDAKNNINGDFILKKHNINVNNNINLVTCEIYFHLKNQNNLILNTIIISISSIILLNIIIVFGVLLIFHIQTIDLQSIINTVSKISKNQCDYKISFSSKVENEISCLAMSLNDCFDNFDNKILKINASLKKINTNSANIMSNVKHLPELFELRSSYAENANTYIDEITTSSEYIVDNSEHVNDIANKTLEKTQEGVKTIQENIDKMKSINNDSFGNITKIFDLGVKAGEISKIIGLINKITNDTELLAFNAALEAASAGKFGKRFGVIATEIRLLASNVMESTVEVVNNINGIEESVDSLVEANEIATDKVMAGMKLSKKTGKIFEEILNNVGLTTKTAKKISLSAKKQNTSFTKANETLENIEEGTKNINNSILDITKAFEDLNKITNETIEFTKKAYAIGEKNRINNTVKEINL